MGTAPRIMINIGKALIAATSSVLITTIANKVVRESTSDLSDSIQQLWRFSKNSIAIKREA